MRRRGLPDFEVVRVRTRRPILTLQGLSGERAASPETPAASAGTPSATQGRDQGRPETGPAAPNRPVHGTSVQSASVHDRGVPSPDRRPASQSQAGGSGKSGLWGSVDLGRLLAEAEEHYATVAPPVPVAPALNAGYRQAGRAAPPRPVPARIVPDKVIPEAAASATTEPVPDIPILDAPSPVLLQPERSAPDANDLNTNELDTNDRATTETQETEPAAVTTQGDDEDQPVAATAMESERPSDAELAEASRHRRAGRVRSPQRSAARPPEPPKRAKQVLSRRQPQGRSAAKRNSGAEIHARDPLTLELPFPAAADASSAQGPWAPGVAAQPAPSPVPGNPSASPEKPRSKDMTPEQAAEIERLMREIARAEAEREAAVRQVVEARKNNARMRRNMVFSIVRAAGSLGVPLS